MPILTTTCRVNGETDNGDGSRTVSCTWGYSDDTTFTTDVPGLVYADHAELETLLRATVADPDHHEQAIIFTYA